MLDDIKTHPPPAFFAIFSSCHLLSNVSLTILKPTNTTDNCVINGKNAVIGFNAYIKNNLDAS